MSKKRKDKQVKFTKKEKQQGEKVVMWIFGGLIALAILYAVLLVG